MYNEHRIRVQYIAFLGWSKDPGPPNGGEFPRFFFCIFVERRVILSENILSVFIDESGDFGPYESHSPYYIVSMILHEQSKDILSNISDLDAHVKELGYKEHAIHVGPLIRRESIYENDLVEERKRLFSALFNFVRKLPFSYISSAIKKKECKDVVDLTSKLSKAISENLLKNQDYFNSFDKIIVYYDNGQVELTKIVTTLFSAVFSNVEFRKVAPVDYKLFQVADLICSIELLSFKSENIGFSNSEKEFFYSYRDFKKNYLKNILRKKL